MWKPGTLVKFNDDEFHDGWWGAKEEATYGQAIGEVLECHHGYKLGHICNKNCLLRVFFHGMGVAQNFTACRFHILWEPK